MFGRFEIRADKRPIRDKIRFRDGDGYIDLDVCADPAELVMALAQAQDALKGITAQTPVETVRGAAQRMAGAVFGDAQAEKLMAFYQDDPWFVLRLCGEYFSRRLRKKLSKAQKQLRRAKK